MNNYIQMFVDDNNLEKKERFNVYDQNGNLDPYSPYYFDDSLVLVNNEDCWNIAVLRLILHGKYTIKKIPFKPKDGAEYWTVVGNLLLDIKKCIWCRSLSDYKNYHSGLVFRTEVEAMQWVEQEKENFKKLDYKEEVEEND